MSLTVSEVKRVNRSGTKEIRRHVVVTFDVTRLHRIAYKILQESAFCFKQSSVSLTANKDRHTLQ